MVCVPGSCGQEGKCDNEAVPREVFHSTCVISTMVPSIGTDIFDGIDYP